MALSGEIERKLGVALCDHGAAAELVAALNAATVLVSPSPGVVVASQAVVVDANRDVSTIRNLGVTTVNAATVNAPAVKAGASGTAGTVSVFPTTAAKGKVALTTADNSGDTTTNINVAAQAAARTLTVPDPGGTAGTFQLTAGTVGANGLVASHLSLLDWRNPDGTVMDATGGAGLFKIALTLGTSMGLAGENAKNNTKTDDTVAEVTLPPTYIAGQNLTVTFNAKVAGSGTVGTKTVQVKAYLVATTGGAATDIGPGTTSALTTANADYTATITGASLTPGAKLLINLHAVLQETADVANINVQVNSVRLS